MLSEQQATSAIALVGRSVSYTEGDRTQHGVVDSLRLPPDRSSRGPADVPLGSVTEVSAAVRTPAAGTAT